MSRGRGAATRGWEEQGNQPPRVSRKEHTLILTQQDPYQTSDCRALREWVSFTLSHRACANFLRHQYETKIARLSVYIRSMGSGVKLPGF